MLARPGNNPKRRIAATDRLDAASREQLSRELRYTGSANHKTRPADYGFHPPANPRAWKSVCDGVRTIPVAEARRLFEEGILRGMFSDFSEGGKPKYVWSVGEDGEAYEAKVDATGYHGYRLEDEDDMRHVVLREWMRR
jgi:hypothetical protein